MSGEFLKTKSRRSGENSSRHHYGCSTHLANPLFYSNSIISPEWPTRLFLAIGVVFVVLPAGILGIEKRKNILGDNRPKTPRNHWMPTGKLVVVCSFLAHIWNSQVARGNPDFDKCPGLENRGTNPKHLVLCGYGRRIAFSGIFPGKLSALFHPRRKPAANDNRHLDHQYIFLTLASPIKNNLDCIW